MSYEIGSSEELEFGPYNAEGFTSSASSTDSPHFRRTVIDDASALRFYDPSADRPMETSRFLSFLRLDRVVKELEVFYKDLDHFHYPVDAMLRTIIYQRLAGLRHTTQLASRLANSPIVARSLGFKELADGTLEIPDRRTIDHFVWKRMGRAGTATVLNLLVIQLRRELKIRGIEIGKRIAVDSTPLEGMHGDVDAEYNGHYELFMYKIHQATCVDTGLSLAKIVSRANDYDGDYLIPLIGRLQELGIVVEEVIGDQHYGTLRNYARLNVEYGITTRFNLSKADTYRYDGTPNKLRKQYNAFWREPDYRTEADPEYVLRFLLAHGIIDSVGAYFRNQWFETKHRWPNKWQELYDRRTVAERFHSHVKEQLGLERNLRVKGIEPVDTYTNLFWIAEIAVALTRVQNGVKDGLLKANQRDLF